MEIIENLIEENRKLKAELAQVAKALEQSRQSLENCKRDHNNVSSMIIQAQENERKLMAFELHDVLGKSLTAIKFSVEHLLMTMTKWKKKEYKSQLENVVTIIQETIKETRELTTALWPPVLSDLGILATISWYSREFEKIYPWVFVSHKIAADENQIPDDIKIVIFRILQESMNNSIKHSGCKNIEITLEKINHKSPFYNSSVKCNPSEKSAWDSNMMSGIRFAVSDNGRGFTPPHNNSDIIAQYNMDKSILNECSPGLGLLSMKERCRLSGGTLEIESATGSGTVIKAFWHEKAANNETAAENFKITYE